MMGLEWTAGYPGARSVVVVVAIVDRGAEGREAKQAKEKKKKQQQQKKGCAGGGGGAAADGGG